MRLLDKPIRKTAEVSNQQAIMRLLAGTGLGAGAGALGEFMLTGRLGWKGAVTGGALGTGAAAFLDPESRSKLVSTVRERFGSKPEAAATTPVQAEQPQEDLSVLQQYRKAQEILASGVQIPEEHKDAIQKFVTLYEAKTGPIRETINLFNKPEYRRAAKRALSGSTWEGMTETSAQLENQMISYMHQYKQKTGQNPSPEHMYRFASHGKDLPEDQWGEYMAGTHRLSGDELQEWKTIAPQLAGNVAVAKLSPAIIKKLLMTKGGPAMLKRIAGKGSLPGFVSGTAGQGIRSGLAKLFRRKATKAAGYGGIKLGGKLGAKASGKALAKAAPGINLLLDSFDLFHNPKTGKYEWNVKKIPGNIRDVDELMEKRERHGNQVTGQKRNVLYNQGLGGLRGWIQPVTTMAAAGRRIAGTNKESLDAVRREGFSGAAQHMKAMAGVVPDYFAELYNVTEPTENKKIRQRDWGSTRRAPTPAEIEAYRRKVRQ